MLAKKCPKCGAVWYTALPNCAFCGVEGVEVPTSAHTGRLPEKPEARAATQPERPATGVAVAEAAPAAPVVPAAPPSTDSPTGNLVSAPAPIQSVEPPPADPPAADTPKIEPEPAPAAPVEVKVAPLSFMVGPRPETVTKAEVPEVRVERSAPRSRPALTSLSPGEKPPDPSTLPSVPPLPSGKVPLIFALLGLVGGAILGVVKYVPLERRLAILALIAGAVLIPFAPAAWLAGLRYENRCIHHGFRPAALGRFGRIFGAVVTFLLALGGSALAVLEALRRMAPGS